MKSRKRYLLAKIESVYGTAETLAAANAIITSELDRKIYDGPVVSRDNNRATLGARQQINTAPMVTQTFSAEMMGSGTLGTPPNCGAILRACGFAETIDPGVDVQYSPVSASYESVTTAFNLDGEQQTSAGMRGNGGISIAAGQIPKFKFSMMGFYERPVASVAVTPAPTPNIVPLPINKANTTTVTLNSVAVALQSMDIDFGTPVEHLNLPNYEEVLLTDRQMTGNMVIIAPLISELNVMALLESHSGVTTYPITLQHGTTPKKITITIGSAQIHTITEVNISGERGYSIDFNLLPNGSGNNDIIIRYL